MRKTFIFYFTRKYAYIYVKHKDIDLIDEINYKFMKYSEVINYSEFVKYLNHLKKKYLVLNTILRPNIYILYNDISFTDIRFIYKEAFNHSFYPYILNFIKISDFNYNGKLVYFDDCYTNLSKKTKFISDIFLAKRSILVGKYSKNYLHYSDKNYFWSIVKESIQKH